MRTARIESLHRVAGVEHAQVELVVLAAPAPEQVREAIHTTKLSGRQQHDAAEVARVVVERVKCRRGCHVMSNSMQCVIQGPQQIVISLPTPSELCIQR